MLIVLGFDSFDAQRVEKVRTPNVDSLVETGVMHTPAGLKYDELNTMVLWPSMLVGENPKELFPEYYASEGVFDLNANGEWKSSILQNGIDSFLRKVLPVGIYNTFSAALEKVGVEREPYTEARLSEVSTVIDSAKFPLLISFPGLNWDDSNRELKQFINPYAKKGRHDLEGDAEKFERMGARNDIDRLIRTLYAIEIRENDLLIAHFFSLDLVQHLWAGSPRKMKRWYGFYDHILGQVLDAAREEDTVVVVSDHGMEETGIHSKRAFFGASRPIWNSEERKAEDLAEVLKRELESGRHAVGERGESEALEMKDETVQHLKDLGYF